MILMKKVVLLLIIFVFLFSSVSAQLADSSWPMFHGGPKHGGQSNIDTSHIDGTIKWIFETEDGIESGPVIAEDGTIYFGSHDGYLYAVNPDGTEKWKFQIGEPIWDSNYGGQFKSTMATPAIAKDGTIYAFASSHNLIAVNPDGTEKWRYPIKWSADFWSSPAIGNDGTIYIGSAREDDNAGLHAINPDGTLKWIHKENTGVTTPPTIGSDGTIYIGAGIISIDKSKEDAGKIIAINHNGEQKWQFDVKLWVEGPSTVYNNAVYINTKEGDIYSLTLDGKENWRFSTGDGTSAGVAVGPDGNLYVGSWDTYFYSLTSDGKLRWKYKTPDAFEGVSSSAAIGSEGTIYVGSNSGMFYAFNPDGTVKWNLGPLGPVITGPAIAKDGTIYFGSWDKKLYAIGFGEEGLKQNTKDVLTEDEWIPKDNNVDCFMPESEIIKEKCDIFCNNHLSYCPGYFEREEKNHQLNNNDFEEQLFEEESLEEKIDTSQVSEDSRVIKENSGFFSKIFGWIKNLFG
jgi:outer membrane protein assembly factor BamB